VLPSKNKQTIPVNWIIRAVGIWKRSHQVQNKLLEKQLTEMTFGPESLNYCYSVVLWRYLQQLKLMS
jgi:hypothetical protein